MNKSKQNKQINCLLSGSIVNTVLSILFLKFVLIHKNCACLCYTISFQVTQGRFDRNLVSSSSGFTQFKMMSVSEISMDNQHWQQNLLVKWYLNHGHHGKHSVIPPQTFGEEWKFWTWFAWGGNWLFILPGEESFWLGNEICKFSLGGEDIFEIWKCNNSLFLKHF